MLLVSLALLIIVIGLGYIFMTWNFDYWRKRRVPGPTPRAFTGNFPNMYTQKRHMVYDLLDIYRNNKQGNDFVGIFSARTPQLLITSPEMVRRVFVTDFKNFHDNEVGKFITEKSDFIIANNPFSLTGELWKERRAEVTPGLTMSRIKAVYPVTNQVCRVMSEYIREQSRIGSKDGLETRAISLRFTADVVTDCVLGLKANSFADKPTPIYANINRLFEQTWTLIVSFMLLSLFPMLAKVLKVRFVPVVVERFFMELMQTAIDARRAQESQGLQLERVDFLKYMLQLQEKKNLDTRQLTARTMTFLLDGFETTATVLSHVLLLLARDTQVQDKLRKEILEHLNEDGILDFDQLHELPYLDACVHETIRIFPPGFMSNKACTEPLDIKNGNGHSYTIEKGESIVVPLHAFMMDEDYFPNPEKFQPERFTAEPDAAKKYRERGVYLGFGDGPRVCLGMRFAQTQIKAALVELLQNFNVTVNPKTRKDNEFDPSFFLTRLRGGVWLNFEQRQTN